jgi:hypothetical protein
MRKYLFYLLNFKTPPFINANGKEFVSVCTRNEKLWWCLSYERELSSEVHEVLYEVCSKFKAVAYVSMLWKLYTDRGKVKF